MELSGYLAILRRWWWTLLVAVWVAGLLGFLIGSRIEPTYESSVRLLVGPINTDTNTLRASGQLVQTYAELAVSQPLLESTASALGLPPEAADELAASVRTTANDQTRILTIRVQGPDPAATTKAANAIAGEFMDLTSKGTSLPEGQVQVIEHAKVPDTPIAPQISIIVLMAAAAGLLGALILILLAEYLADRVQDGDELARITGESPLATIPAGVPAPLAGPSADARRVPVAAYGAVVAALAFPAHDTNRRELVIATADDGAHGADLALGFAAATAAWRPVLYIDADPAGTATGLLGIRTPTAMPGGAAKRVIRTGVDGLRILPAGALPDLEKISPADARALLGDVVTPGDVVIVDVGNIATQSSAMVWAGVVGSAVLAVRRGSTQRTAVREAVTRLGQVHATLVGSVLVESRAARSTPGRRRTAPAVASVGAVMVDVPEATTSAPVVEPVVAPERPAQARPAAARRRRPDQG